MSNARRNRGKGRNMKAFYDSPLWGEKKKGKTMRLHDIEEDEQGARDSVRLPDGYTCADGYCGADDCLACFPEGEPDEEE